MDSLGSQKSKAVREAMRSVGAAAVPARLLARSEHNRAGLCQALDALLRKAKPHLANEIASRANPVPEEVAGVLTWGADEHLILGCAAAAWIALTISRSPLRPASSHLLLVAAASAALPHGLKLVFDQVRPDRKTLRGHLQGIPLSGDSLDAFPSGHAVHMGALTSAASQGRKS